MKRGIYGVATIFLIFGVLLLFRNPILSVVLSRALDNQHIGQHIGPAFVEVISSTPTSITLSLRGNISRGNFSANVDIGRVNVSFSISSIVSSKVGQVFLEDGKIHLTSPPVRLDTAEVPSKEEYMSTLAAALFTELPFERLELKQIRISLEDERKSNTEIGELSGWITAGDFSLSAQNNDTTNAFSLQGVRDPKSQNLEFRGSLAESFFVKISGIVLPASIKIATGQLQFTGQITKREKISPFSALSIIAEQLSGSIHGFQVEGGRLQVSFPNLQELSIGENGSFSIASIQKVLEFQDVQGSFAFRFDQHRQFIVEIDNVSAHVVGGVAKVSHGVFPTNDSPWGVDVALQGIDLEKLLALYPQSKFMMTGIIDAQLPISRNHEGMMVKEGHIESTTSGRVTVRDAGLSEDPENVLRLLRDFSYDSLQGDVSYLPSGDLTVSLKLSGRNPEWQKGQPVNLNVTISENLLTLLQSIRFATGAGISTKDAQK